MSASREKKQRQSDLDSLTEKQKKDRQEAAAQKRKVITYWIIGIVAVVIVVVLLVWNSGILVRNVTAATVGEHKYSVTDVTYYYQMAADTQYQWSQYGLSSYDPSLPDSEQIYNAETGQTYQEYFQTQALETLTQVTALLDAAEAEGYTLSADGQAQIDAQISSIEDFCINRGLSTSSYFSQRYGKLVKESDFKRLLTDYVTAYDYSTSHQNSLTYDDAAIQAYYDENSDTLDVYDYRYFFISGSTPEQTDEEGNTIEPTEAETAAAMSAAKLKAEQALEEIEGADDREAAFIEAAPKYVSESSRENYEEDDDYSLTTNSSGSSLSSRSFGSWMMDAGRKSGDVTYTEDTNGYYVVLFLDRRQNTAPSTVDIRHILIKADLTQTDDPATEDTDESAVPTQEALDAAKAECERILAEWEGGDKTAESFGALAEEYSDDTRNDGGSLYRSGGLYEDVTSGYMFSAFNDWIFDTARQSGDTTLIENPQDGQQGWHIVYFQDKGAPSWKASSENALRSADQSAWLDGLTESYEAAAAEGMSQVG